VLLPRKERATTTTDGSQRQSMTGFGRGEAGGRGRSYTVEVHSVNHRFLEVRCRLSRRLAGLEQHLTRAIAGRFARGHFEVAIQEKDLEGRARTLSVDIPLARQYVDLLRSLRQELGIAGEVTLDLVAGQRELVTVEETGESLDELWPEIEPALRSALDALREMRAQEGAALVAALERHLDDIAAILARVIARGPELVALHRTRLRERLAELLEGRPLDFERLEQEVAIIADRGDVTEECDRLASHVAQFRDTLPAAGPQGRRLDFLLQEMNREANTIGSKAADAILARDVIELKTAIERLREQVQNLE
jgi:uncharacterized protein (TIGR00255 family)